MTSRRGEGASTHREGVLRTQHRPAWWRGLPLQRSYIQSPPSTALDDTPPGPSIGLHGASGSLPHQLAGDPDILLGDEHPPVTYTDEHGNFTVGHMHDLSLFDSPVNSDTNDDTIV
jgi:hypothetical protein